MSIKKRKNARKPKRRRRVGSDSTYAQTRSLERLARSAYLDDDDPEKALEWFEQAEAVGPLSDDSLGLYLDVLHTAREVDDYARIALTMVDRRPGDPMANMLAGSACYSTMQPVSAIVYWEKMIQLDPSYHGVGLARQELAKLRKYLPEILDAFVDDLPKELPRIASVENILHFFKLGRFDEVILRCQKHLDRYPNDLRARNNLAEAFSYRGDQSDALEVLDETIRQSPQNFYAHAVRSRVLYFCNRKSDSAADAAKLRTLTPKQISDLTKAAQTFAFRGDDDEIGWAYGVAADSGWLEDESPDVAMLMHYEATRLARADEWKAAKTQWKKAVRMAGGSTQASENLDDLRQPIGERHGPFFFDIQDWFSRKQLAAMQSALAAIRDGEDENTHVSDTLGRFIQQNREVESLLPDMLDRGDGLSVQFAAKLAQYSDNDDAQAALRDFVSGSRGTDSLRSELAGDLHRDGILKSETIELYVRGKLDRIEFIDFEITDEPVIPNDLDEVCLQMLETGVEHLHAGEGAEAEEIFRRLIQSKPDAPDIKNNLAMALQVQDRMDEANRLIDEVIDQHPDYFFGQIALAKRALQRKEYDQALETLMPLQRRKLLHATEFVALAQAMVYTFIGRREFPSAERWLGMLQNYDPDNPSVGQLQSLILLKRDRRGLLSGVLGGA